ncbi:hypothetical protein DICPUDRAFT_78278 [Dictyostelium purpureum]|uniref:Uncharacterized protein n=1 Tax=Dictyostelium purpureum TaxID=5786 RepID=F0ZJ33_DICPU|nr:uncharacterized protein DICPUDRAFT_78278 [Dictyostelium purpureum]EGC36057.1 hypothetical protein DICPUDRAFT_78278 [Dictyostelium purpureum]|eukprot:XP_003287432.1 hypothetical protein DICPUDRAFT_78278 [Dictyostelium purpureum]
MNRNIHAKNQPDYNNEKNVVGCMVNLADEDLPKDTIIFSIGSGVNIIPKSLLPNSLLNQLKKSNVIIRTLNNQLVPSSGVIDIGIELISNEGNPFTMFGKFEVVEDFMVIIIGLPMIGELKLELRGGEWGAYNIKFKNNIRPNKIFQYRLLN